MIAYKFRLYPNKTQQSKLWIHANKLNYLYNYFLNQRKEAYKKDKSNISRYEQQKELILLKQKDDVINEIHSQVLQQVPLRLDKTYSAFFRNYKHGHGFPKFRICKNFFGILYPQSGYSVENNKFITKIYGRINFRKHRKIQGNIKQIMITTNNDKWYIVVTTDFVKLKHGNGVIGIDVGITNLVALSDGTIIKNQADSKYFDKIINELKSRRDSSTKKASNRNKFLSKTIKRLYGVKDRKVTDFLHKVSHDLSNKYDTIILEDLSLKKMSEGKIVGLNRELRNSQLATFANYLKYKTKVIEVNPYNTSKTCNRCGRIHEQSLKDRVMDCTCGNKEDRDVNAAKNIYCLGRAFLETGRIVEIQEAITFR